MEKTPFLIHRLSSIVMMIGGKDGCVVDDDSHFFMGLTRPVVDDVRLGNERKPQVIRFGIWTEVVGKHQKGEQNSSTTLSHAGRQAIDHTVPIPITCKEH